MRKIILSFAIWYTGKTQKELAEKEFIYTFLFRNKWKAIYYTIFK